MNPIMNLFANKGATPGNNVFMQALGAMMRGESPQAFMQNLAKTNPQLNGLDFTNMQDTAQKLCDSKGVDVNQALQQVTTQINANK